MNLAGFTRWQAAAIHLGISAAIALAVVGAMRIAWYPAPYFDAAGGAMLLLLLVGVDVVVGPLLTLVVYSPQKKHLHADLAVIAALQLAALAYGVSVMYGARPVYVAFAGDRFELVAANAIADEDLALAASEFRALPRTGPRIVGTRLPADSDARLRLGLVAQAGGSIGIFPQYYAPYDFLALFAATKAKPLEALRRGQPGRAAAVDRWVAGSGRPEAAWGFLPLQARHGDMAMIVDAETGAVAGVLAIDPW